MGKQIAIKIKEAPLPVKKGKAVEVKKVRMGKFVKGSPEAKAHMAKLRAMMGTKNKNK